jgi:hypothetical protein
MFGLDLGERFQASKKVRELHEIRFVEDSFQKVSLGPDDVIVLQCQHRLGTKRRQEVLAKTSEAFPGHGIILMAPGWKIGAISPESTTKSSGKPSKRYEELIVRQAEE